MNQTTQRILEGGAILSMIAGVILLYQHHNAHPYAIYGGFFLLATAKIVEVMRGEDTRYRIPKIAILLFVYIIIAAHLVFGLRSFAYIMLPLVLYFLLHRRTAQKETSHE